MKNVFYRVIVTYAYGNESNDYKDREKTREFRTFRVARIYANIAIIFGAIFVEIFRYERDANTSKYTTRLIDDISRETYEIIRRE